MALYFKLFEKIVFIQFTEYRKQNKLLFEGQNGFRENHSIELATIELMDMVISALDEELTLTIYMDLSKAFDTLDHNILLAKLRNYGINETPIRWSESNLTNILHYVELNDLASKKQKNHHRCATRIYTRPLAILHQYEWYHKCKSSL